MSLHQHPSAAALALAAALAGAAIAAAGPDRHPALRAVEVLNDGAPYPQCHASTIAETAPGRLVAAWFGGTEEKAPDVGIWVTRFESGAWTVPVEVATGVQPGGLRHPTWNPVLFAPPGRPLLLFYKVGPSPREWWGMVMASRDGGRTWGPARRLPAPLLGPIKNKPVMLPDGSWLSPSSTESAATGWDVHFERSRDHGRTWSFVGPLARGPFGLQGIQPSVLFHRDGRLQAIARTRNGVLASSWSRDNGATWSALEPTALPNPNSGTDAVTLRDGRQLLVYNPSTPPPGASSGGPRYPLVAAVSDDGVSWANAVVLEDQPMPDGYAYPAVIQSADNLVHVTYTWNRRRIKHAILDPSALEQ
ncbi:MAG TPA: exo-alpha-sialidase [Vicinamibacterales bacterium]|nr:exo-alpha-sialidase [Vicinamibacterales bacterium]